MDSLETGRIVQAIALLSAVSIIAAVDNGEFNSTPAFAVTAVILGVIGTGLVRWYGDADPPQKRDAMVTAVTSRFVIGVLGALPF